MRLFFTPNCMGSKIDYFLSLKIWYDNLWLDTKRQFPMMVHFSQVFKDNQMHVPFKKNLKASSYG